MDIEKILSEAPEGATHFSECINSNALVQHYLKLVTEACDDIWHFWWDNQKEWWSCDGENIEEFNSIHSLDDLREIQRLRAENEALCKNLKQGIREAFEAGAEAVEVALMTGDLDFDVEDSALRFAEKRSQPNQAAKG